MTTQDEERWLWDRSGPPEPEVERLEALLAPLAHAGTPVAARSYRHVWAAAAAVFLAVGGLAAWALLTRDEPCATDGPAMPVVADGGAMVGDGEWIEAGATPREVRFGDLGRVTLEPGSRMQVARADQDLTRFFLERGKLEAFVSASARPRFFEVETQAVRCVDLGCQYELTVEPSGVSRVKVLTGQVSFEVPGREAYVPAGALCEARPGAGPGTPRFEDASADLVAALARYDASARDGASRTEAGIAVLALVRTRRDALVAWHLLGDSDPILAEEAHRVLTERFGPCGGCTAPPGRASSEDLARWREHLGKAW